MKILSKILTASICILATFFVIEAVQFSPSPQTPSDPTRAELTTSVEPAADQPSAVGTTSITFVGDMMFDRYIREQAEQTSYEKILHKVKPELTAADMVVANVEGPITDFESVTSYDEDSPDHFTFTFNPKVADLLADYNISTVSLGNNHIENFGSAGVEQTTNLLNAAGINYFGSPLDEEQLATTVDINRQRFGFVAYNYADELDAEATENAISALKEGINPPDWIMVFAHWGGEYEPQPAAAQRRMARSFVDAGADLIVGAHPHVIQPKESYRGVPIYYSLGNFVFDQYFSPNVRCGLMLTANFTPNGGISVDESFSWLAADGSTRPSDCREAVPTTKN